MQRIVIAGDRTVDRFFYSQPAGDTGQNWQLVPSTWEFYLPGGVLMLEQLIRAALDMRKELKKFDLAISTTPAPKGDLRSVSPESVLQSSTRLEQVPAGKEKQRWRVSQPLGFQGPQRGATTQAGTAPQPLISDAELIVLDDHGNSFRNDPAAWPGALTEWKGGVPIIHKMRHPLNKGRQPDALWECLESKLKSVDSPQYVLVVSADDLRETEGVRISKGLSWERTAKEFLFQLKQTPALKSLQHCPCIVVLFGWEGAIVYRRVNQPTPQFVATLHFDSQRIEGGFEAGTPGTMFGMTSVFLANLVGRIVLADEEAKKLKGAAKLDLFEVVDGSVPEGLARARLWLETAFETNRLPSSNYPLQAVFPEPAPEPRPPRIKLQFASPAPVPLPVMETEFVDNWPKDCPFEATLKIPDPLAGTPATFHAEFPKSEPTNPPKSPAEDIYSWTMIPPVSSSTNPDPADWRIGNQEWPEISVVIAMEYMRTGKAPGLLRSLTGVFGKLKAVDRLKIESFNAIRALVQEFLNAKSRKRPLCLGVFGPPDAGKSFGVEEVIRSIGGERVSKLTFNVSQFSSETVLVAACHRIRDKVLEGKTPFVFFDEIDSAGHDGTTLGWLRSFLALMQDGKFRDGEEMHPLGKCILVFAGGTSDTFFLFEENAMKAAPAIKGRDFVSRLHGYINIMGPNPQGDDPGFVLRRAIVLRSMLERSKDAAGLFNSKQELQIDTGVLRALLLISEYKHGTRSLESLLDMSQLEGQTQFDQYALPPRDQLLVHVPADEFISLMQPRSSDSSEIEQFKLWLKAIGCDVRPIPPGRAADWGGTGDRPQTPLIGDDEIVALAKLAHQWWSDKQTYKSIALAAEEDPGKETPYLCAFADLPIAIRTLIVSRVEQIPVILHDAGLEIVRPNEPADWSDAVAIETLAEIVHGSYQDTVNAEIEMRRKAGFLPNYNSNKKPFAELPPAKQESNRDSVRSIPRKLARIGLKLVSRRASAAEPTADSIAKIKAKLEELAVIEHTRWNWHSLLQGYVYKPGAKSDELRTNPNIVPWDKLPESIRDYDRVKPKHFAGLIFQAGYEVV